MAAEKAKAEQERKEQERLAAEKVKAEQERKEQERLAAEKVNAEQERKEQERLAAEKVKAEQERKEQERLAAEKVNAEQERKEQERLAAEKVKAEQERKEQERLAAEKVKAATATPSEMTVQREAASRELVRERKQVWAAAYQDRDMGNPPKEEVLNEEKYKEDRDRRREQREQEKAAHKENEEMCRARIASLMRTLDIDRQEAEKLMEIQEAEAEGRSCEEQLKQLEVHADVAESAIASAEVEDKMEFYAEKLAFMKNKHDEIKKQRASIMSSKSTPVTEPTTPTVPESGATPSPRTIVGSNLKVLYLNI